MNIGTISDVLTLKPIASQLVSEFIINVHTIQSNAYSFDLSNITVVERCVVMS